jgi:hypothetical protein
LTSIGSVSSKLSSFIEQFNGVFLQRGFRSSALHLGLDTIRESGAYGVAVITAGSIVAIAWLGSMLRETVGSASAARVGAARPIVVGAAVFVLAWLPVLLIQHQEIFPRLCYAPLIGAALMAGGLADCCVRVASRVQGGQRKAAAAAALVAIAATAVCTVMMIGCQRALQLRSQSDERHRESLRSLAANLPGGVVIVPLAISDGPFRELKPKFSAAFTHPLERPWSATPFVRMAMRRADVMAAWYNRAAGWSPRFRPTAKGLMYDDSMAPDWMRLPFPASDTEPGYKLIPWGSVQPVVIDDRDELRFVGRLWWNEPDCPSDGVSFAAARAIPTAISGMLSSGKGPRPSFKVHEEARE